MKTPSERKSRYLFFLLLLIAIGLAIRTLYVFLLAKLGGDAAVFALMAKHISEFREFPLYLWLAHYAGTLSSYIGAVLFWLFGVSSTTYMFTGIFLSSLWIFFTLLVAKKVLNPMGCIIALILVILPPFNVLRYSLYTGGIHAENLLCNSLLFLLIVKFNKEGYRLKNGFYLLIGFSAGIGLWLTPGVVPMLLTMLTVFIIKDKKIFFSSKFPFLLIGFLIGCTPAIIYNFQHHGATFFRFGGRILTLERSILSSPDFIKIIKDKILWRISTIPGSFAKIPFLTLALMGTTNTLIFFTAIFVFLRRKFLKIQVTDYINICLIFMFWFAIFYAILIGTRSMRYMLPLYTVFPILVGKLLSDIKIRSSAIFLLILGAILLQNSYGLERSFHRKELDYKKLTRYLLSEDLHYGYSDYWTAYPVIFESGEKVLLSPTLFYLTCSDRRPEYTTKVKNSEDAVFIIPKDAYPKTVVMVEEQFKKRKIGYKKEIFNGFIIYRGLTEKIDPEQLGLSRD